MEQFKLFNFYHGLSNAMEDRTGNFTIKVTKLHCDNILLLKRNPVVRRSLSIKVAENLERSVEHIDGQSGQICETAIVEIDSKDIAPSLLYPSSNKRTNIDDLALVLSFYTGRRVYLEADLHDGISQNYKTGIVDYNIFYPFKINLGGIEKIANLELENQFINLVHSYSFNDIGSLVFYTNSVLNAIYGKWFKENKKSQSQYNNNNIVGNLLEQFVEKLKNSLLTKIKIQFINYLQKEHVSTEILSDIKAKIRNVSLSPSALNQLKSFLIDFGLYPEVDNENQRKRLKWLNTLRNRMFHSGDFPKDKNMSYDLITQASTDITFLVIAIVQYYFAKNIFEIDNYKVIAIKKEIMQYFTEGKFRGKDVFNETDKEYLERVENAWLENGNMS